MTDCSAGAPSPHSCVLRAATSEAAVQWAQHQANTAAVNRGEKTLEDVAYDPDAVPPDIFLTKHKYAECYQQVGLLASAQRVSGCQRSR